MLFSMYEDQDYLFKNWKFYNFTTKNTIQINMMDIKLNITHVVIIPIE